MKATIIDDQGKIHEIALDQVPFLLQKKADLLPEHMDTLLAQGKKEEAVRALCQILYLVQNSCQKGFTHTNENLEVEYGFLEGRAIYFRSIYLPQDNSIKSSRGVLKEVFNVSKSIESWLQRKYPELVPDFLEELQDILSSLED